MENIFNKVESNMDNFVDNSVWWSNCASEEQMADAKTGQLELTLGISKPVPKDWISDICGKKVLCLAGAGGLQAPLCGRPTRRYNRSPIYDESNKVINVVRRS